MPSIGNVSGVPRRALHIFYVLDTSGSMAMSGNEEGTKISVLNRAMENCIEALKEFADKNADAELKIAVLEFSSGCKWVTFNGPESLEDFEWESLEAGGQTDFGVALRELNAKLSPDQYLASITGAYRPIIIFMTDGYPTDDYERELESIKTNKFFSKGVKIGFVIGEDADEKMITSVVGNPEAVIRTNDLALFSKLLVKVSVTSSMIATKPTMNNDAGEEAVRLANDQTGGNSYKQESDIRDVTDDAPIFTNVEAPDNDPTKGWDVEDW